MHLRTCLPKKLYAWTALVLVSLAAAPAPPSTQPQIRTDLVSTQELHADFPEELCADEAVAPRGPISVRQRSEHLARVGVVAWHKAGLLGGGVKVAILDSGFRGYQQQLGKALPERVKVRSFRSDGNLEARNSQHGILCGEVVHALAPEAELLFANWESESPETFLNAVRWARDQGANIISCSVIMPSWSDSEGGGSVHAALTKILGSGNDRHDVLFFASAGNTAQRHWSGSYHAGTDGCHEWLPGKTDNLLRPWGEERVSLDLGWTAGASYDAQVIDENSGKAVACTEVRDETDRHSASIRFQPRADHTYRV